jgi:hypothetical protein
MAVFSVGVAVLVYLAARPSVPDTLKVSVSGLAVDVDARRGGHTSTRPLEYDYDFDGDGKPEIAKGSSVAKYTYPRPGVYSVVVKVRDPRWGTSDTLKKKVEVR